MKTMLRTLMMTGVLVVTGSSQPATEAGTSEEQSVRPGINGKFLDPDLKVEDWLKRFEVESREIFTQREKVVAGCRIRKGMTVADIGAGTGLYTRLFSEATGPDGWVYAAEINGRFLEHINARARQEGQKNITPVLCPENAVALPANSLDLAFVCDVYHHFEYPKRTMASLVRALKRGGTLVVIDFERIPGKSREWTLGHVRAGKEVFKKEIEAAGLVFAEEVTIEGFKENYFLRFRKE